MDPNKTSIILGPPGTGKTTRLLKIVEGLLQESISPADICFIAFTRKAANEAKDRAVRRFGFQDHEVPWFRTLHSLAFKMLGLRRENVMSLKDYLTICDHLGLTITFKGVMEDGTISGLSRGDRLFFMENMSRATKIPLKQYWEMFPDDDINWYELERLQRVVTKYKESRGKVDFTDMVQQLVNQTLMPDIRVLIVDEAQDLTALQWDAIEVISTNAEEIFVAGDDDQAIFNWAGAAVDKFMDLQGKREVLPQSYRVPQRVQEVAGTIISRCKSRIQKDWHPTPEPGQVTYVNSVDQISMDEGSWMLLARNVYLLEDYTEYCLRQGYIFDSITSSPISARTVRAIRYWEALRSGEKITVEAAKLVYDFMSSRIGVQHGFKTRLEKLSEGEMVNIQRLTADYGLCTDKIWHEALDRIPKPEKDYYVAAIKRGEKLTREPRIKINTIHGVKGGEADNVVIKTDMAYRTWQEFHNKPDDEHRVWYVACTRAKQNLYIIQPQTDKSYAI